MVKFMAVLVLVILFYVLGGFSRYNPVSAYIDASNKTFIQVHAGYPYKPDAQQLVAKKLGFQIVFSGCVIWPSRIGEIAYNKIALFYMKREIGDDVEARYRAEMDRCIALINKFEKANSNPDQVSVCGAEGKIIETRVADYDSLKVEFDVTCYSRNNKQGFWNESIPMYSAQLGSFN